MIAPKLHIKMMRRAFTHWRFRSRERWPIGIDQQAAIVELVTSGRQTQAAAARLFHVHPATVSRLLAEKRQQNAPVLHSSCDE